MAHARRIRRETLVVRQLGPAAGLDELRNCPSLPTATMIQPSRVWNVWYGTMFRMRVAPAHRRLAAREVGVHVREQRDLHVEQCHVDVLAFAGPVAVRERGEHRDRRVEAGRGSAIATPAFCGPPPGSPSRSPVMLEAADPWMMKS